MNLFQAIARLWNGPDIKRADTAFCRECGVEIVYIRKTRPRVYCDAHNSPRKRR